ncbi:hypothetical protein ACLB6G_17260 [Zhengella sp. ZM62]|uniref:hypothetical protein n=1 Tax=Zhengella sedimenti TaxID=3390035 RepID=UPI0039760C12
MFQATAATNRIDEHLLLAGAAWLAFTVILAVVSGISGWNTGLPHAYAFMAGFCGSFAMGLTYRLFPGMKSSRLSRPQAWIWQTGLVLLVAGRIFEEFEGDGALFQFASVVSACGALLFVWIFVNGRVIRPEL